MKFLKKLAIACCALSLSTGAMAADNGILAFPGAEGFGRFTTGGRGGEIYHVTNLNDSGTGSLRDAVSKPNRIVVFDVSGVIELKSVLVFSSNLTVLGQTAPGEGIQVYGNRVSFSNANNTIIRYIRFRMGIKGDNGKDAAGVASGHDMIFDHLSVLWGRDENFSISSNSKGTGPQNITVQNSIIGQGLQSHSCGGLIQTDGGVTLYRNLYIENKTRNPKVKGLNQYVNNVVYNWGDGGCYIMSDSEGDSWADIQNNYFMRGPWNGATKPFSRGKQGFRFYGAGNYYDDNKDGILNGYLMPVEEMLGTQSDGSQSIYLESIDAVNATIDEFNAANADKIAAGTQIEVQHITPIQNMMTAEESYAWILENVGPTLPVRDEVDQYIIDELASYGSKGTKNGISSESQLPHRGTGTISGGVKPLDTDGDGIPDSWETANGLNPNDASDAAKIDPATGYAWIELYANSITEAFPYIKKPIKFAIGTPSKTSLSLSWDVNKNTEHGFVIEVSTDGGLTFTEVATAPAGATTAELTTLQPMTAYQIRLRATDGKRLYSDYTDTLSFETSGDPTVPFASELIFPANGAKEGIANGINFTWKNDRKAYGGDVTYSLFLGTDAENLTEAVSGLTATEWNCTTLEANKTYYWRVDATNSLGTTPSEVFSFTTTAGGVLFYTDFHTCPASYAEKFGSRTDNPNVFNAANQRVEFDGMVIGSGSNAIRVVAMSGCFSEDLNENYGPASEEDRGATAKALQFYTTKAGGYIETPEVQGPCVLTVYFGNTGSSQQTVKIVTIAGGEESTESYAIGAKKRIFKYTKTYTNAGAVKFRIDANGKKFNINDILVERYIAPEGDQPLELTSGEQNNSIDYTDGNISLGFNQEVKYNGGATISGIKSYEDITIAAGGTRMTVSYEALDANSEYVVNFPAGALTDAGGEKSFVGEVKLTTGDFPRAKQSGETHWGKAIKTLPVNFAPFNTVAPFETVGGLVQTSQNDYPHWCYTAGGSNAGEVTADHVTFRSASSNDKVMAYFDGTAKKIYLEVSASEGSACRLKIQETRNADIAPTWRTIRVLSQDELPFKGELELNPESRFVKIVPASVSGDVTLNAFRISDADGNFGPDFSGIADIIASDLRVSTTAGGIRVSGLAAGIRVNVYDIAGRTVASAVSDGSDTELALAKGGFYLVNAAGKTFKIRF